MGGVLLKSWRRDAALTFQRLAYDVSQVCIILPPPTRAQRNVSTCNECVSVAACFFCHSATPAHTHTPRNAQTPPFPFLITPLSVSLSLFLKEFSIHLIPLLVLLYCGWARSYSMSKAFHFIEHQILCVSPGALVSLLGSMHIQEPTAAL